MQTLYFLGGGNMALAIIQGLLKNQQYHIHVVEHNALRREQLMRIDNIDISASLPKLCKDDILLLAVKPQDIQAACRQIICDGALVLSIAAGLSITTLTRWLGHQRIIRMMPNLPAQVGLGITGIYAPESISTEDRHTCENIMQTNGTVIWLDSEEKIHNITAIAGSGPGYVFYLLDAFFQAALQQGFTEQVAKQLVLETVHGALSLATERNMPFAQLQKEVTSKGGTTAAALAVFSEQQTDTVFQQAIQACANRSRELAHILSE